MKFFLLIFLVLTNFLCASDCVVKGVRFHGDSLDGFQDFDSDEECGDWEIRLRKKMDDFAENGFPFAAVSYRMDSSGIWDVAFSRGSAYVWALAENAENSKTKKENFARLSGLEAGSLVRLSDLERAERKLVNSGYFESVASPRIFRDSVRNRLVPVFYMRDLSVNSFEGLLSYASGDAGGWAGNIDLNLFNMRGTGRDLTVSGQTGEWGRSLSASYKEPWLFGTGWNGIVRGFFEEDSSFRDAQVEAGVSRSIGFFFDFAILGGMGSDRWIYTLELHYRNEDRVILPRHGMRMNGTFLVSKDRSDSLNAFTTDLHGDVRLYTPLSSAFVLQTSFWAGTLLPTDRRFKNAEQFALGGMTDLKGFRNGFFRTRAYGIAEMNLQWRALESTAFHLFFEPALHRARTPAHGWEDSYSYGVGISQYRGYWSFSLYYALRNGKDPLDGLLHFGVKTLF